MVRGQKENSAPPRLRVDARLLASNPVLHFEETLAGAALDRVSVESWLRAADAANARMPQGFLDEIRRIGKLPRAAGHHLARRARTGPVGLGVVTRGRLRTGVVVPLHADESAQWAIDRRLPFDRSHLQDLLARLLRAAGGVEEAPIPERLRFRLAAETPGDVDGPSMDGAALLAIVDALTGRRSPLLASACAIVQIAPRGDGKLDPVAGVREKLEAFAREIGKGSLLIRSPRCTASRRFARRSRFAAVWSVGSLAELARRLAEHGLLQPLIDRAPLGPAETERALARLHELAEVAHDYPRALDLAERLRRAQVGSTVGAEIVWRVRSAPRDVLRHLGRHREAIEVNAEALETLRRAGGFATDDAHASAVARHAASLYDGHRFEEMTRLLSPWCRRVEKDPGRFRTLTRVEVLNTWSRAAGVLGRGSWRARLETILRLQREAEPLDVPRTQSLLAGEQLRNGDLSGAETTLRAMAASLDLTAERERALAAWTGGDHRASFSLAALRFLEADLHRRRGTRGASEAMDAVALDSPAVGHVLGFYHQAVARQAGTPAREAARRFRLAQRFFEKDLGGSRRGNGSILVLFSALVGLARAAAAEDRRAWSRERERTKRYLRDPENVSLRAWLGDAWRRIGARPSVAAVERLLAQVPYFLGRRG